MVTGRTPDLTPAQLVAAFTWLVSQAVAYGWLDTRFSQIVLSAGSTLIALGWQFADAHIRHGRAKALTPVSPPPAGSA